MQSGQGAGVNMEDFQWIANPKKLREFRMRFSVYDKNGDGIVTTSDLAAVLQEMDINVTVPQLTVMMREADVDGLNDIHFDEFLMMVAQKLQYEENKYEIFEAFKEFDNGRGFVKADEFRSIMKALGDRMSEEEVDEMFHEVRVSNGLINISDFVDVICR